MSKFVLTIDLGNAEMYTNDHVRDVLRNAADVLEDVPRSILGYDIIRDINGNTVGEWKFVE